MRMLAHCNQWQVPTVLDLCGFASPVGIVVSVLELKLRLGLIGLVLSQLLPHK